MLKNNNNNNNNTYNRLQRILDDSTMDNVNEIMKEDNLKDAHIYCKINKLSGQTFGVLIEKYIEHKYKMIKNNSSKCSGDMIHNNNNNIEIKVSLGGKHHSNFNYVQLRMNHDCNYLLTAYYINNDNIIDGGELYIFSIEKDDMKNLILKYGSYAHGTIKKLGNISTNELDDINNHKEYSIRPKYGDKCWNELLNFRIDEYSI